jgi:hypothetical protein
MILQLTKSKSGFLLNLGTRRRGVKTEPDLQSGDVLSKVMQNKVTKITVMSLVHQIHDVTNLLGPVLFQLKLFYKDLLLTGQPGVVIPWDEVPEQMLPRLANILEDVLTFQGMTFPRSTRLTSQC